MPRFIEIIGPRFINIIGFQVLEIRLKILRPRQLLLWARRLAAR